MRASLAGGRTSKALPRGHAAWRLFSARTLISWKQLRGATSATRPASVTGLHALNGARYLRDAQHADAMLCRLVAHHSCATIEAGERGLADGSQLVIRLTLSAR
jgi:hypothetical protein